VPRVGPNRTHVFHLYVVQVDNRDEVQGFLKSRGIGTGVHYPIPIHLQEACAGLKYGRGAFPATENAASRILSLPMYAELTREQQEYVVRNLVAALDASSRVVSRAAR